MPLYAGMTVNERLVVAGQIAAWDEAVIGRDRAKMIEVLMAVELTAEQAAYTTDTTLANPEKAKHASRANALRRTTPQTTWKETARLVNREFGLTGDNAYEDPLKGKRHIRSVHREHHGDKAQKKKRG